MNTDIDKEEALFCPQCGGASVNFGELVGALASCRICNWSGNREDLYNVKFMHMYGGREGIALELSNDLRRLIGSEKFMTELVSFLGRWGFIDISGNKKELAMGVAKYASHIARAVLTAVIEVREKIEKEKHGGARAKY